MRRPRISTNLAISADGKISSVQQIRSGWTSADDHDRLLRLRQNADALLVGRGTLEKDRMTLASPGHPKPPLRCIVSARGRIDPGQPLFHHPGGAIHWLVTGPSPTPVPAGLDGAIQIHHRSLSGFLETLVTDHGVNHLHCEGGGRLIFALAEMDAIDEFHLTLAGHTLFGGQHAPTPSGIPGGFLPGSRAFELDHFEPHPDLGECFLSYRRVR